MIRFALYRRSDSEVVRLPKGKSPPLSSKYIDARPAKMNEDFRELALDAMDAAWPCKK